MVEDPVDQDEVAEIRERRQRVAEAGQYARDMKLWAVRWLTGLTVGMWLLCVAAVGVAVHTGDYEALRILNVAPGAVAGTVFLVAHRRGTSVFGLDV